MTAAAPHTMGTGRGSPRSVTRALTRVCAAQCHPALACHSIIPSLWGWMLMCVLLLTDMLHGPWTVSQAL